MNEAKLAKGRAEGKSEIKLNVREAANAHENDKKEFLENRVREERKYIAAIISPDICR
jgi:hypothetical protein